MYEDNSEGVSGLTAEELAKLDPEQRVSQLLAILEKGLALARATLVELARSKDEDLRKIVAKDPNCPLDALWFLSKDYSIDVRANVANNPSASTAILQSLSQDEDAYVALQARKARKRRLITTYLNWHYSAPEGER